MCMSKKLKRKGKNIGRSKGMRNIGTRFYLEAGYFWGETPSLLSIEIFSYMVGILDILHIKIYKFVFSFGLQIR
jgi:hypothetical protein